MNRKTPMPDILPFEELAEPLNSTPDRHATALAEIRRMRDKLLSSRDEVAQLQNHTRPRGGPNRPVDRGARQLSRRERRVPHQTNRAGDGHVEHRPPDERCAGPYADRPRPQRRLHRRPDATGSRLHARNPPMTNTRTPRPHTPRPRIYCASPFHRAKMWRTDLIPSLYGGRIHVVSTWHDIELHS